MTGKPLGDVLIKSAVSQRPFSRHQVRLRFLAKPIAQVPHLRNRVLGNGQVVLGLQVHLAGVLLVQFVQPPADIFPQGGFFRGVVEERRAEAFQPVLPG